jgi:hypothetical protein
MEEKKNDALYTGKQRNVGVVQLFFILIAGRFG